MIRRLDPATDDGLLPGLAALLVEAVSGGASIGFMAGLGMADALTFWQGRSRDAATGGLVILVALDTAGDVMGTVSLATATPPNQPHRADVQKMVVATRARGRGVGAALLAAAEAQALAMGRTTLVLDTITGSTAARLYARGGWAEIGTIPAYALMPDGTMASTTIYTRHL